MYFHRKSLLNVQLLAQKIYMQSLRKTTSNYLTKILMSQLDWALLVKCTQNCFDCKEHGKEVM